MAGQDRTTRSRLRAERWYQQLDLLQPVREEARRDLLRESRKHEAVKRLQQFPAIGPIRAALLVALLQHLIVSARSASCGLTVVSRSRRTTGEYRYVRGKIQRNRERITVRGLNDNHDHDLKNLFKGAALSASTQPGPLHDFYVALLEKGMRPTMARLTLAEKDGRDHLDHWKKGVSFDAHDCIGKPLERLW